MRYAIVYFGHPAGKIVRGSATLKEQKRQPTRLRERDHARALVCMSATLWHWREPPTSRLSATASASFSRRDHRKLAGYGKRRVMAHNGPSKPRKGKG